MIGRMTLRTGDECILEDDGRWYADDPVIARHLNTLFNPADPLNQCGLNALWPIGYGVLRDAAEAFGVEPQFARPLPSLPPGAIM